MISVLREVSTLAAGLIKDWDGLIRCLELSYHQLFKGLVKKIAKENLQIKKSGYNKFQLIMNVFAGCWQTHSSMFSRIVASLLVSSSSAVQTSLKLHHLIRLKLKKISILEVVLGVIMIFVLIPKQVIRSS